MTQTSSGDGIQALAQMIMDAEVSAKIGAVPYERSEARTAYRNGYRTRTWDTRVGTVELKIPKVSAGTYFPSLLEPRWRAEKALQAVIVEAYVKGISTRKVDDLVRALGAGSRSLRSAASAKASTRTSWRFATARSTPKGPTCGSMRPTTRCARTSARTKSALELKRVNSTVW